MSSQFAAHFVQLGQLFADPFLPQAPPYQRSYAWTSQEAGRLLEDVCAALEASQDAGGDGDYFLGTMLFIDHDHSAMQLDGWPLAGSRRSFEVVDGLQRLTTLSILFCVLRDLGQADDKSAGDRLLHAIHASPDGGMPFRLHLPASEEAFFRVHVRNPGASRVMAQAERLSAADERILAVREHFLAALSDHDSAQRQRLITFLLDRCYVVLIATTGIDRAHHMFMVLNDTGKPLARNEILKADLLGSIPPAGLARAMAIWNEAELRLGRDFESLFSHIRAMHGRPGTQVISGIRTIAAECGGAEPFILRILQPAAAVFDDIRGARHSGSTQSLAIARSLTYLGWLPSADWIAPAMLWWLRKGKDAAELAWFLAALERLAYGMRVIGFGTSKRAHRFGSVISAIRSGRDLKAAASPLNFSRDEQRAVHYNLRDLHARNAPIAKLILLRLNDHIAGQLQVPALDELTVEHVLPRKPGVNSAWRTWFPDPQQRDQCTRSLGNLVLVTRVQNDKAGNQDFARKKEIYFDLKGAPSLPINEYVRHQAEWKAAQIEAREAELMRHLDALWSIGTGVEATEGAPGTFAQFFRYRRSKAAASA